MFAAGFGLAAALLAGPPEIGHAWADNTGDGAFRHLQALQDIASANGGNRAAGTPGYDRSADYVAEQLKAAGYAVRFEEFDFPFFEERTPPALTADAPDAAAKSVPAAALRTLNNSGSGDVTARLRGVRLGLGASPPAASTSGCEAGDFEGFERGAVALVRRGTCTFQVKVENAVAAGAIGVVIMNEGTEGRIEAFSGQLSKLAAVPVVGVPFEQGSALDAASSAGATVHLAVDAITGRRVTRNVIADAPALPGASAAGTAAAAGASPVIIVGAHLDSVPEGPGINDNGSGSAAVLEAALRLAPEARGLVRFGFWGAEERGLIGSRRHVDALTEDERKRIALYINLDMVGSPNHVTFVQSSATSHEFAVLARSELLAEFHQNNLPVEERSGGRYGTDDASFSQKGIATVGLYTGAGGAKSENEAGLFGGVAGRPYDPCYHRACDTIGNIDRELLEQNTRALERALNTVALAAQTASIFLQTAPKP
jgi:Zn-dependent M28 family amino/carboxypeptidase